MHYSIVLLEYRLAHTLAVCCDFGLGPPDPDAGTVASFTSMGATTTCDLKLTSNRAMNVKTQDKVKPKLAKVWLVRLDPMLYREKAANMMRFWLAKTTRTPSKNPMEKDVGKRFKTKVPETPRAKWTSPVHMEAITKAMEPPFF
jgi:hypothetical protein